MNFDDELPGRPARKPAAAEIADSAARYRKNLDDDATRVRGIVQDILLRHRPGPGDPYTEGEYRGAMAAGLGDSADWSPLAELLDRKESLYSGPEGSKIAPGHRGAEAYSGQVARLRPRYGDSALAALSPEAYSHMQRVGRDRDFLAGISEPPAQSPPFANDPQPQRVKTALHYWDRSWNNPLARGDERSTTPANYQRFATAGNAIASQIASPATGLGRFFNAAQVPSNILSDLIGRGVEAAASDLKGAVAGGGRQPEERSPVGVADLFEDSSLSSSGTSFLGALLDSATRESDRYELQRKGNAYPENPVIPEAGDSWQGDYERFADNLMAAQPRMGQDIVPRVIGPVPPAVSDLFDFGIGFGDASLVADIATNGPRSLRALLREEVPPEAAFSGAMGPAMNPGRTWVDYLTRPQPAPPAHPLQGSPHLLKQYESALPVDAAVPLWPRLPAGDADTSWTYR